MNNFSVQDALEFLNEDFIALVNGTEKQQIKAGKYAKVSELISEQDRQLEILIDCLSELMDIEEVYKLID